MAYRFSHRPEQRNVGTMPPAKGEGKFVLIIVLRLSCMLAAAILLLAVDVRAQTSTVIGTIKYSNGKPAVNVLVSVGDNYRYTDVGGRFKIAGVPQGRQHVSVKSGKRILWQGDVDISGAIATVDRVLP